MTVKVVPVVRGTSLSGYRRLVAELGGDPGELLRAAGIRPQDVGEHDAFLPYRSLIVAIETAAAVISTPDFGRRLALRQGIEILGPLGVAARGRRSLRFSQQDQSYVLAGVMGGDTLQPGDFDCRFRS